MRIPLPLKYFERVLPRIYGLTARVIGTPRPWVGSLGARSGSSKTRFENALEAINAPPEGVTSQERLLGESSHKVVPVE